MAKVYATGRRKTAIAKVWLENGNGQLTINGQTLDAWLGGHESIKKRVMQPLNVAKQETSVNVVVQTLGGGYSAQADAVRHGISRALVAFDEQFRTILKPHGLLTRDARSVERKKYGKKKARKSSQKDNWYFSLFTPKGSEKSLPFFIYSTYKFLIFLVIYFQTIKKIINKDDL